MKHSWGLRAYWYGWRATTASHHGALNKEVVKVVSPAPYSIILPEDWHIHIVDHLLICVFGKAWGHRSAQRAG